MRFLYAKLVGYIGIYNGLGKTELEIDFTKSKNNITVINGPNGCGKSTLLKSLNIIPHGNENFVPSMNASKQLRSLDGNTVYDILINHPIDSHNNRATTKAYISKDGVELNPNGNVSSYKDIVFEEFDLDSNFITLSHLSSDDRGLADKRPGERKKFIASISSSLETYNGINKTMNKKSNYFKAQLNALTSKINGIGSEESVRMTLAGLLSREKTLQDEIDDLKNKIVESTTVVNMNDPSGAMQQQYSEVETQLTSTKEKLDNEYLSMSDLYKLGDYDFPMENGDAILNKIKDADILLASHEMVLSEAKVNLSAAVAEMAAIAENKEKLEAKIDSLSKEVVQDLELQLQATKDQLMILEMDFKDLGIDGDIESVSKEEILQVEKIVKDFLKTIDTIYTEIPTGDGMVTFMEHFRKGSLAVTVNEMKNSLLKLSNDKAAIQQQLNELLRDSKIASQLDNKPSSCKIKTCPFLQEPLEVLGKYGGIKKLKNAIRGMELEIEHIQKTETDIQKTSEILQSYLSSDAYLRTITNTIEANQTILSKFRVITQVFDQNALYDRIANLDLFNDLRTMNFYNASNAIVEYKSLKKIANDLESDYKVNQSNIKLLEGYRIEQNELENKFRDVGQAQVGLDKTVTFEQGLIKEIEVNRSRLNELYDRYISWDKLNKEYLGLTDQFESLKRRFQSSAVIMNQITEMKNKLELCEQELKPILEQKKTAEVAVMMLNTYKAEYAEYSDKYEMIEKLKKYSSPVKGGIQTLFMSLYMSRTLELANELLGMIFKGQYRLLDYVINQDEFRMPFIGNGMAVDDISSGSTSQICIMGMIINLVLLNQASTRYNITRLDELDGGLDVENRTMFVSILQQIISILNIEQLFIISHSIESTVAGFADVIRLAPVAGMENDFSQANVIYSF